MNNRLLCELITHKDFIKFLADIEIYVDGIANMQIQSLNTMVDSVRKSIIEKYQPQEEDYYLQILQATHINNDEYFSHMISDDLHAIIKDIRESHKKDSDTAPENTIMDELKKDIEDATSFKGSLQEKQAILSYSSRKLYCPVSVVNSFLTTLQSIPDVLPLSCYPYQNLHFLCD